jgi:pyridoxal phosphate enzyme (YggS family)
MERQEIARRIAENVAVIRGQMHDAAVRSGRSGDAVRLVAVTKYVSSDITRCLFEAGVRDLGESRPQQLWDKATQLADLPIHWHFIGHLQRNKVNRTLPLVSLLHSLDTIRLGDAVEQYAATRAAELTANEAPAVTALLEVNISGDSAKHGFTPPQVADAVAAAQHWPHLRIVGLMAMAGREGDDAAARSDFQSLRQLRDQLGTNLPPNVTLDELSMGMSGDFPIAIEEGATIVRVGSALFEGIDG